MGDRPYGNQAQRFATVGHAAGRLLHRRGAARPADRRPGPGAGPCRQRHLRARRAHRLDTATGLLTGLFDAGSGDVITDASAEGGRLLVARTATLSDGRDRVETAVYDVAARRFLPGDGASGLRDARFFRGSMGGHC